MRKKLIVSFILCIFLALFVCFVGCNDDNSTVENSGSNVCVHNFSGDYQSNNEEHWKNCLTCGESSEHIIHNINDSGVCNDCGITVQFNDLEFYLNDDGESYRCIGGSCIYNVAIIPSVFEGKPVTCIKWSAPSGYFISGNYEKLIIPESIVSFNNIASFSVPETVKEVIIAQDNPVFKSDGFNIYSKNGEELVRYLINGTSQTFNIPEGVKVIGSYSFAKKDVKEVNLSSSVVKIESGAFSQSKLEKINLNEGLEEIDIYAFESCGRLSEFVCSSTIKSIGNYAFEGCSTLANVSLNDGLTYIGFRAFNKCYALKTLYIPSGITYLGSETVFYCDSLKSIYISDTVEFIEPDFFSECMAVNNLVVDNNNPYFVSIDGTIFSKDLKTIVKYAPGKMETTFEIPSSVETIGVMAFSTNNHIKNMVIPSTVKTLCDGAFLDCNDLRSVEICEGVEVLGEVVFANCLLLGSVSLPNSLTEIGQGIFQNSQRVTFKVYNGWKYIGNSSNPYMILYEAGEEYKYGYTGKNYITSLDVMHENCVMINPSAFYDLERLASVVIGDNITVIGEPGFYNCDALETVVIGKNVISIKKWAFYSCDNLKNIYFKGDKTAWDNISVDTFNDSLFKATIYFYSEKIPEVEGNYWYYNQSGEIAIW